MAVKNCSSLTSDTISRITASNQISSVSKVVKELVLNSILAVSSVIKIVITFRPDIIVQIYDNGKCYLSVYYFTLCSVCWIYNMTIIQDAALYQMS